MAAVIWVQRELKPAHKLKVAILWEGRALHLEERRSNVEFLGQWREFVGTLRFLIGNNSLV